jgi:hypothetical protein
VALYSKMHHAGIDGQASVALAKVLYSDTAVPAPVKPPHARSRARRPSFGVAELAGSALRNAARQTAALLSRCPRPAQRAGHAGVRNPTASAGGR